jgi:hypothetical protein
MSNQLVQDVIMSVESLPSQIKQQEETIIVGSEAWLYSKQRKTTYSGTTPYPLRASASLHMKEYTCNSKGGNHQKPQTHPTEQLV